MTQKRLFALALALTLAACSMQEEEFVIVEPVMEEPVVVDQPDIKRNEEVCPQSGDGIGGTGCPQTNP